MKDKETLRDCPRLEKTQRRSHDDRMQCDVVGCVLEKGHSWKKWYNHNPVCGLGSIIPVLICGKCTVVM